MREKYRRFMYGRYGQNGPDQLYRFMTWLALGCIVVNWFVKSSILYYIIWFLLIYSLYRHFSKNYQARYAENQKYLQMAAKFRYWLDQQKKLAGERKYHHIYTCPKCKQKIRIPKGKGKIMVRCPKCQHEFQKRS